MSETPKTVFVTRYALTGGIIERDLYKQEDRYAWVRLPSERNGLMLTKDDWHTTREAAVARAEAMRDAKLAGLEKQAERLRKLTF